MMNVNLVSCIHGEQVIKETVLLPQLRNTHISQYHHVIWIFLRN